jgi:hypothetical protein
MPSDDIIRLYTFTAGTDALAAEVNGELDQIIATMNAKVGRGTVETISGNKTFSGSSLFSGASTFSGNITASGDLNVSGVMNIARATDPSPLQDGDIWYNSATDILYSRINGATYDIAGYGYSLVTTNTTLTSASKKIDVDCSGGSVTITLPPLASSIGQTVVISKYDNSFNTVTIDGDGAELIGSLSSYKLFAQFESISIHAATTGWFFDGGIPTQTLLETKTASASSPLIFSTVFDSAFSAYRIDIYKAAPSVDNSELLAEVKVAGSFVTSSYHNVIDVEGTASDSGGGGKTDAAIRLVNKGATPVGIGFATAEFYTGSMTIYNPADTNGYIAIASNGAYWNTGQDPVAQRAIGRYNASGAVTQIQFRMDSGNIASGVFKLYGIR